MIKSPNDPTNHWKQLLRSPPDLLLPTDYPRSSQPTSKSVESVVARNLQSATCQSILKLSLSRDQSSPFSILLAAFAILLVRSSGQEDLTLGSSSSTLNPLVLRLNVSLKETFEEILESVHSAEQSALDHEIPFHQLLDCLAINPTTTEQPPLFRVRFFNLTDTSPDMLQGSSALSASASEVTVFISQSPTLRQILPIHLKLVYNSLLFSHARMEDLLDQLELLLTSISASPNVPMGSLSLVTSCASNLIPNPTASLDWDGFKGAITDIFARNAQSFPDRSCVIESGMDQQVVYTYDQIHQASNLVAHHLIRKGIQREDVVVLYSYRGVDLVVAIMGVLKAGATFSVIGQCSFYKSNSIDPAYPPSRQIVYLSVAQPRGLVILRKAGTLHQDVRDYMSKELEIVVEIPSLQIAVDGSLSGDLENKLFIPDLPNKGIHPNVTLGPDSIGTLSFTSGSTGIPKGVRGRHFSLTHFYPWMQQEFELSEKERFTMLSGIAHDPIQRDSTSFLSHSIVFTPLFLGAQLHIPTAEDIGSPGRLAEWMAEHTITVTHLTPAMGQLLSANASHPIPSLRHAFFVGDVLTKRDVNRLQHLAQNTHVINMYGTTETQRAVSFLKIPPVSTHPSYLSEQKDIMPAGTGMKNVQLLVINPAGLLCGIGEVGEIFVRSGGLAEGYLRLDDVTATKFIPNPFNPSGPVPSTKNLPHFLGPRDRMYRTGDLGRYKPDGSVECTGRADDQVKIRGFRIELGEIDTHLSQHPAIRENVTLVKRDKYEEQTLVSYFVPLASEEDVGKLVQDIRAYLKKKLPSYAIPAGTFILHFLILVVFVPLIRMPLTPNGKVDKNALPFPDTALALSSAAETQSAEGTLLTSTQSSIRDIWSKLLNVPTSSIRLSDAFFDLGGHSILATRLVFEIRKTLAVDVPLGIVYREPTLQGMAAEVETLKGDDLNLAGQAVLSSSEENVSKGSVPVHVPSHAETVFDYAADLDKLDDPSINANGLALEFPSSTGSLFFLTGVTGFLGAFILSSLLKRFSDSKVICLVRAKDAQTAYSRVKDNLHRHLLWDPAFESRCQAICGDLGLERLGLDEAAWDDLSRKVDLIIHNGALVSAGYVQLT